MGKTAVHQNIRIKVINLFCFKTFNYEGSFRNVTFIDMRIQTSEKLSIGTIKREIPGQASVSSKQDPTNLSNRY